MRALTDKEKAAIERSAECVYQHARAHGADWEDAYALAEQHTRALTLKFQQQESEAL